MLFKTPAEVQDEMKDLTKNFSKFGKTMEHFHFPLISEDFITNISPMLFIDDKIWKDSFDHKNEDYLFYRRNGEPDIDNGDFLYRVNRSGFRSAKFEKLDKESLNILTVGCSVTFGMGMPEELIWPTLLKNKIAANTDKNVNMYNLSVTGMDSTQLIHNVFLYIQKYGSPDYIFALLPPVYRKTFLEKNFNRVSTIQENPYLTTSEEVESYLLANYKDYGVPFFHNVLEIKQLEILCSLLNIKLQWGSWCYGTSRYYSNFNFKNYSKIEPVDENYFLSECQTDLHKSYWKRARDKKHNGYMDHLLYTKTFFDWFLSNEK